MENGGIGSFNEAVIKTFKYCFDLEPLCRERASTSPLVAIDDMDEHEQNNGNAGDNFTSSTDVA